MRVTTTKSTKAENERRWADARNARRREAYATDPDFKERTGRLNRGWYRSKNTMQYGGCRKNIAKLASIGVVRTVTTEDGAFLHKGTTFRFEELANAINRNTQVIRRYVAGGLLPPPLFFSETKQPVYSIGEARAVVTVLADHYEKTAYYRQNHTDTREKIFFGVEKARLDLGITISRRDLSDEIRKSTEPSRRRRPHAATGKTRRATSGDEPAARSRVDRRR